MSKSLVEIKGFTELQRQIQKLPDKVKKREMLKVLGQVANSTLKAARLNVPVSKKEHLISGKRTRKVIQPGNLYKSLGKIKGKKGLGKENAVLYVGPRSKGKKNDGFYGAWVHEGTVKQKANPFMDRAYNQTKGRVTADAETRVTRYVQRQIDRLSK